MPAKLDRCVDDIKAKGKSDGVNPWAVCNASIKELKADSEKMLNELDDMMSSAATFPSADASYKHTGSMVTTDEEDTYGNTEQIEDLQEIDDMIAKQASLPKASYKFTGPLETKLKPDTYGNTAANETVSIPGSLSAVKIKGKKKEGRSMLQEIVYKSILDTKLNSCGCSKKKLKETSEGGVGSGRKKTQPHGPKSFDVPKAVRSPKAKPAMPERARTPMSKFTEQVFKSVLDSKANMPHEEGGPGSGPRPGGGKKAGEPSGGGEPTMAQAEKGAKIYNAMMKAADPNMTGDVSAGFGQSILTDAADDFDITPEQAEKLWDSEGLDAASLPVEGGEEPTYEQPSEMDHVLSNLATIGTDTVSSWDMERLQSFNPAVEQGLVTSKMTPNNEYDFTLTPKGKKAAKDVLKKYE